MNPHLHAVPGIDENGEVDESMPTTLQACWREIQELRDTEETLTGKFKGACSQITRLRNELEDKRKQELERDEIDAVLEYWRQKCAPNAEIVEGSPKWEKVRARLHDKPKGRGRRTVDELKLAVDGALADDWYNGTAPKSPGYTGWENIFLNADRVEKLIGLGRKAADEDFDERLRKWHLENPSLVYEAIVRERQAGLLYELDPTAALPRPSEERDGC